MTKNKFVLFDGNNLAHIAFHRGKSIVQKEKGELLTKEDFSVVESMMYLVYFRKLHKYIKMFKNSYFIMTWDNPGSSEWRKTIYPEYKANRNYDTDPIWRILFDGIEKLVGVLQYYPMYQVKIEKLEADDILYVYSKELSQIGKVIIISGDSDMIQAAQDFGIKVYHPIKDKYVEIPKTYDYCVFKAIKGDKSDVIQGIYGYGEVKSARLAQEIYGEDFIDHFSAPNLTEEQCETVIRNLKLIRIANNPNLKNASVDLEKIKDANANVDFQKIKKFYFDYKLKSLIETFDSVMAVFN